MFYLCLAVTVVWTCHLAYLLYLDQQARNLKKRLDAREAS